MSVYNRNFVKTNNTPDPDHFQHVGPRIPVEISVPTALASQLTVAGIPIPSPINGFALIDTGASMLAVDERVLKKLGLPPFGAAQVSTGAGTVSQGIFPVSVSFPGTPIGSIPLARCLGVNLGDQINPPLNTIALIGRDMLRGCVLIYNGTKAMFTLAY